MIREGTDALSWGEVHVRELMNLILYTVPLDEAPCARSPELKEGMGEVVGG
jgi:hypothetical protein